LEAEVFTNLRMWTRSYGVILVVCALIATACGSPTSAARLSSTTTDARHGVNGLVDIGGGRKIYAVCRGQGSPAVVLIAGKGNSAKDWMEILDPADPAHNDPTDRVPLGEGKIISSDGAVFPQVAKFTRVCAYDRPDVAPTRSTDVSTPRRQPHTVDLDVSDLHALLAAVGAPGPYVLVGHSFGGVIAELYARTYPKTIGGLVMVDTLSEFMAGVASPTALANWDTQNSMTSAQSPEGVQVIDAFNKINAAPPMPSVPAIVLTASKPWATDQVGPLPELPTFDNWKTQLDRSAVALGAPNITDTNSGHDIYLYSPKRVVDSIREVVNDARHGTPHARAGRPSAEWPY
jgi:pimeloyl-ACP methyl ester carboxylesterase